jgi:hypothetical protein
MRHRARLILIRRFFPPSRRGRRRNAATWIAIVALLINALLPAELAAAMPAPDAIAFGICHGSPAPGLPGGQPADLPVHHCPLCLAVSIALPPRGTPALAAPAVAEASGYPLPFLAAAQMPVRHPAAQPRAPPASL